MPTRHGTISTIAVQTTLLLLITVIASTSATSSRRVKRLTDVECSAGTTKISTPFYFKHNATGWCSVAVGELATDYYNGSYRQECQRWLGTSSLPDGVAQVQLIYCYEFSNGTVQYRMGICCHGNPNGTRCFTGNQYMQYAPYFYEGHFSYKFDYENNLITCDASQVCQTKLTFYGSYGSINNISVVKECGEPDSCAADSGYGNGQCQNCAVSKPVCTRCCNTPFCNFDYFIQYTRPSPCDPCASGPCNNGGWCYNDGYNSTLGYYTTYYCRCPPFWGGRNCEANRTLCSTNQCLNGGTCYDYSELEAGQYRCDCTLPFVGERCELRNNLTCNTADSNSFAPSVYNYGYASNYIPDTQQAVYTEFYTDGTGYPNCTKVAWTVKNKPELVYYKRINSSPLSDVICGDTSGRASAYKVEFEVTYCAVGSINNWLWGSYRSCCYNISRCNAGVNPCLNGGTCYDYSTITPGDNYRCECLEGFVGDNCELKSNLTCSSSDPGSIVKPQNAAYKYENMNCTAAADYFRGKPYLMPYVYQRRDFVNENCIYSSSLTTLGGHQFRQGIDGQIGSDMFQFELTHCSRTDHTSILQFRGCCPGCLSSPCLNGGYCLQLSAAEYVCKCAFGFNGRRCENSLSICTVTGDPHYHTFDSKLIDYQGTCKYNLASSVNSTLLDGLPYFNVYARSINRDNVVSVSYPWYVDTVYNGTELRLLAGGPSPTAVPVIALVNGTQVQFPYKSSTFDVDYDGTTVRCDTDFGLSVTFDGFWTITVSVPATYAGKMTGMCGDRDDNPNNDLTTADGRDVSGLANAFNLIGDSYAVPDPEQPNMALCPAPPQPPPCANVPQNYTTRCGLMNSTAGVFSGCISRLGQSVANTYADSCIMDSCFTGGLSICRSIKAFVDVCAFRGVQIPCNVWQLAAGCGAVDYCPTGTVYQCASSACPATCADPNAPNSCTQPNKDTCVCPSGQLFFNGSCTANCPVGCLTANKQLKPVGSSWSGPDCTLVTCTQPAQLDITSACRANELCVKEKCYAPTTIASATTTTTTRTTTTRAPRKTCSKRLKRICKPLAKKPISSQRISDCKKMPKKCNNPLRRKISLQAVCKSFNFCKGA